MATSKTATAATAAEVAANTIPLEPATVVPLVIMAGWGIAPRTVAAAVRLRTAPVTAAVMRWRIARRMAAAEVGNMAPPDSVARISTISANW